MRTANRLFERLCDPEHLDRAADATVRGKRRRKDVAWFLFRREEVLARLHRDLVDGTYQPGDFDLITIRDPKPRVISRMPIEDRVVHTALVDLMEPVFLRGLRPEAYACRQGWGTHRAVLRLQELTRRFNAVLHLDVKAYFPSIDLEILRRLLARKIRDARFLDVVDRVLDAGTGIYEDPSVRARAGLADDWPPPGRGLPIGAYTSQLFAAHVYLAAFDHFVKHELKIRGYARYVDDMFFFALTRRELREAREAVARWLDAERGLRLKHPRARVLSCHDHLNALGYRISRTGIKARPRALRRMRQRIAADFNGYCPPRGIKGGKHCPVDLERSIAATAGVVLF